MASVSLEGCSMRTLKTTPKLPLPTLVMRAYSMGTVTGRWSEEERSKAVSLLMRAWSLGPRLGGGLLRSSSEDDGVGGRCAAGSEQALTDGSLDIASVHGRRERERAREKEC